MEIIKLQVEKQNIVSDRQYLVSDTENVYQVEYDFDEEWNEYTKFGVFKQNDVVKQVLLVDNKCQFPNEVITERGYCEIGVYGVSGDKRYPTIFTAPILVQLGVMEGTEPTPPTPTEWQQIINELSRLEDDVDTLETNLNNVETRTSALEDDVDDLATDVDTLESNVSDLQTSKQDKLTAGRNIKIQNNVISAELESVVYSVNGKTGDVELNANDVGALPSSTPLFSGDYNDLSNKPSIPNKTSDLQNDSNFVSDSNYVHTDNNFTNEEKSKLDSLENYDDTELRQDIEELEESKVDKVSGKQLSDENYTLAEKTKLASLENYDDTEIKDDLSALEDRVDTAEADIDTIESKIPTQASSTNQLADKEFVNSSIATNTATFLGTFTSIDEFPSTATNNDYVFLKVVDSTTQLVKQYDRYKWNGEWTYEYTLNNSSFTANQWNAINSGITALLTAQITTNQNAIVEINQSLSSLATRVGVNETNITNLQTAISNVYTKTETDGLLNAKQNTLISGTNIQTLNGHSILGSGDLRDFGERRTRRNITSDLSNLCTAIAEQNLEKYGYAIGDYFVGASGYYYYLADMDTYYGYNLYSVVGTHHCGVLVDTKSTSQWLASGNVSRYHTSTLHTFLSGTALNNIKNDLTALFGGWSNHLISHKILSAGVGTWEWVSDVYISALTEVQIYGSRVWSADNYQQGEGVKKLKLFDKFRFNEIFGNISIWLRSVCSALTACRATNAGFVDNTGLTNSNRASGLILFY